MPGWPDDVRGGDVGSIVIGDALDPINETVGAEDDEQADRQLHETQVRKHLPSKDRIGTIRGLDFHKHPLVHEQIHTKTELDALVLPRERDHGLTSKRKSATMQFTGQ
jgi:hypothetical protein